ncbi:MAG: peptidylprolyl isomerase [Bacteroidales bacterium]|nr:peptidylprolyl isomerase [Bacteroidales bacterium]MDD4669780.1 peptidylprolyl isomerase [Bacteroidales bacterium]
MKRIILSLTLIMCILFTGCKNRQGQQEPGPQNEQTQEQPAAIDSLQSAPDTVAVVTPLPEEPVFKIKTSEGDITIQLYKDTPLHRDNFVKLVSQNYYNGILFHRVINGFMIQAGDPYSKDPEKASLVGTGGPGYTIPAEIVSGKTHKKGALAAARRGGDANPLKESSGSQFYLVQDAEGCQHLDGEYTIFGETIDGFDVIDKIASIPTDSRGKPSKDVAIVSITLVLDK